MIAIHRVNVVLKPYSFRSSVKRGCWVISTLECVSILHTVILKLFQVFLPNGDIIYDTIMFLEVFFA